MATTIYEDYSPLTKGDTLKPFAPSFYEMDPATGQAKAYTLSGLTITMKMREKETGETKTCSGSWTIDNAAAGQAHYDWQDADVDTTGIWEMQMVCTNSDGKPQHSEKKLIEIEDPI